MAQIIKLFINFNPQQHTTSTTSSSQFASFKIIKNMGGPYNCLYASILQSKCFENPFTSRRTAILDLNKRIGDHATTRGIWPRIKNDLIFQHKEQIPVFNNPKATHEELQNAYKEFMQSWKSLGTLSELWLASNLLKFNYSVLRRVFSESGMEYYCTIQNAENKKSYNWIHFQFTGAINSGHWEYLKPVGDKKLKDLPTGINFNLRTIKPAKNGTDQLVYYYPKSKGKSATSKTLKNKPNPFLQLLFQKDTEFWDKLQATEPENPSADADVEMIIDEDLDTISTEEVPEGIYTLHDQALIAVTAREAEQIIKTEEFKNRTVVVLGGFSGLGLEIAEIFFQMKANVHLIGNCTICMEKLGNDYPKANIHLVKETENWIQQLSTVFNQMSPVHHLVNVTSIFEPCPFDATEIQYDEAIMTVNFSWISAACKLFIQNVTKSNIKDGTIVNICSTFNHFLPLSATFAASQAAVEALTNSLALEYKSVGIKVKTIRTTCLPNGIDGENAVAKQAVLKFLDHFKFSNIDYLDAINATIVASSSNTLQDI